MNDDFLLFNKLFLVSLVKYKIKEGNLSTDNCLAHGVRKV